MLQQVCEEIHNFFIKQTGTATIENGMISPDISLLDGQRFWILGSVLNDGVYTYHSSGIKDDDDENAAGLSDEDEVFEVCAMAVPPAVVALSAEIKTWVDTYGDAVNSPYSSENVIGVYSYTKKSNSSGDGSGNGDRWQDIFSGRLKAWRKIAL